MRSFFNTNSTIGSALMGLLIAAIMIAGIPIPAVHASPIVQLTSNTTPPNPATTLTQTTLSTALGSATISSAPGNFGGSQVIVASGTGFTVGNRMVIMGAGSFEAMDITGVSSTTITVVRAVAGTSRMSHAAGDVIFTQRAALFQSQNPRGQCSTLVSPTPWVNVLDANIFYCASGNWYQTVRGGLSTGAGGGAHTITYTVLGAMSLVPGLSLINGTTLAMTLASPTKDMDGMIMIIISLNASAQTVTYTAGFNQNTTSSDVATFGGAVNDNLVIVAHAGIWQVVSTRNVTFG
jgi:hypothetical protein